MAALAAGLEVGAGVGAWLAVAACAEAEAAAVAVGKVRVTELARAGMGLPGPFVAVVMTARAAAEVAPVLLGLRTLGRVLERLLDALCHVAQAGGAEVLECFFDVLAFFCGVTGTLLSGMVGAVLTTGAGALLAAAMGTFIAPGRGRWSRWLIAARGRALREGGGGETEGGEKRDDAWCLHAQVENRPRAMVAKFLVPPAVPGCRKTVEGAVELFLELARTFLLRPVLAMGPGG